MLLTLASCGNANGGESIKTGADTDQEAINIAVSYQSIFDGIYADGLTSLSDDTVLEIENKVSNMGYAVTDASGEHDKKIRR